LFVVVVVVLFWTAVVLGIIAAVKAH